MMEEEILENENNTENYFNSNITGSDLNSTNETISNYRMFLNYGVLLGNSLIKNLMQFRGVFFIVHTPPHPPHPPGWWGGGAEAFFRTFI